MKQDDTPAGFEPARFSPGFLDHGGPHYLGARKEGAQAVGLKIMEHHINYRDMAHGGALATLADVAMSWQVYSSEEPPVPVSSSTLTTNFLAPARLGDWIVAETRIDRIGGRSAHVSGRIMRGDETLLTMSGVYTMHRRDA